jgi:hypothetical protein
MIKIALPNGKCIKLAKDSITRRGVTFKVPDVKTVAGVIPKTKSTSWLAGKGFGKHLGAGIKRVYKDVPDKTYGSYGGAALRTGAEVAAALGPSAAVGAAAKAPKAVSTAITGAKRLGGYVRKGFVQAPYSKLWMGYQKLTGGN